MARKLSLAKAAMKMGINAETLRWRVREGSGPPCLIIPGIKRDTYRIDEELLDRWMKKHTPSEAPDRRRVRTVVEGGL